MRVLGIDPGTSCGWALWSGGQYTSGVWNLKPSAKDRPGQRFRRLRERLILDPVNCVDAVFYEEVRRHKGTHAAHIYGGIVGCIQAWCEEFSPHISYTPVPVGTIKKFATGNGRASKDEMLAAALLKWPHQFTRAIKWKEHKGVMVPTDKTLYDQADALWILECGLNEYGRS